MTSLGGHLASLPPSSQAHQLKGGVSPSHCREEHGGRGGGILRNTVRYAQPCSQHPQSVMQSRASGAASFCRRVGHRSHLPLSVNIVLFPRPPDLGGPPPRKAVLSMNGLSYGVIRVDTEEKLSVLTVQDVGQVMPGGKGGTWKGSCPLINVTKSHTSPSLRRRDLEAHQ